MRELRGRVKAEPRDRVKRGCKIESEGVARMREAGSLGLEDKFNKVKLVSFQIRIRYFGITFRSDRTKPKISDSESDPSQNQNKFIYI